MIDKIIVAEICRIILEERIDRLVDKVEELDSRDKNSVLENILEKEIKKLREMLRYVNK